MGMIIKIENSKQNVIQPMEKSRCWLYTTQLLRHIFSQSVSLTQYVVLCVLFFVVDTFCE